MLFAGLLSRQLRAFVWSGVRLIGIDDAIAFGE
jgi:hypothetical protein